MVDFASKTKKKEDDGSGTDTITKPSKVFKSETGKFDSLKEKESFTGTFVGAKHTEITDTRNRNRGEKNPIFVLKPRKDGDESDKVYKFPCAAMMLQVWEDIVDEYGDGDEDRAINALRGRRMTINRGVDSKTRDGNALGNYEMIVWE